MPACSVDKGERGAILRQYKSQNTLASKFDKPWDNVSS